MACFLKRQVTIELPFQSFPRVYRDCGDSRYPELWRFAFCQPLDERRAQELIAFVFCGIFNQQIVGCIAKETDRFRGGFFGSWIVRGENKQRRADPGALEEFKQTEVFGRRQKKVGGLSREVHKDYWKVRQGLYHAREVVERLSCIE